MEKIKTEFYRECPCCTEKIYYKRIYDLKIGEKNNSKCQKCYNKNTRFKSGHTLNEIYSVRENSLDKLLEETPESFYWLGFLIADGSFYKNTFELSLAEKDKGHLEKFAKFIGFTKELVYKEKTKSYRLLFANKKSIQLIMDKYGIIRNKTYNPIDFCKFENYSKDLLLSMLIGIIDGDGNIYHDNRPNTLNGLYYINITAHINWNIFYTKLFDSLNIKHYINNINKTNTLRVSMYKKETISMFIEFIKKQNHSTILNRKWGELLNIKI